MDLLEKYKPTKFADFVGNYQQKTIFNSFLGNNGNGNDNNIMIIIGPNGSGKTSFVDIGINNFIQKYNYFKPEYNNYTNHKEIVSAITNFIYNKMVFNNKVGKILFFDDINILLNSDRYFLKYFIDELSKTIIKGENNIKIILTINIEDEKKICDIKKIKNTSVIKLNNPSLSDCLSYFLNVFEKEEYECDESLLLDLIKKSKCNIRQIFLNIDSCEESFNENQNEFFDMNIFDIVKYLFSKTEKLNLHDLTIATSSDQLLINLIMYENFKEYYFNNFKIEKNKVFKDIEYVKKIFIDSSIIESNAYLCNETSLLDLTNLLKCGSIINLFNSSSRKKILKEINIKYTTILSRLLQYYSNQKKFNKFVSNQDISHVNAHVMWNVCMIENNKKDIQKGDAITFYNAFSKLKLNS
jgi:hypothetical protein